MSDNLRRATFRVGQAGLNGTGITAPEKTAITTDLTALKAATYITQTADATLSAEQALSSLATGLVKVTTGTGVLSTAVAADLPAHTHTVTGAAAFLIDGGGAVITTGIKGDLPPMPFAGTITGYALLCDQIGTLDVQIWKDTLANYAPTVADLLFTASVATAIRNPTGAGPYTAVSHAFSAGDVLRFNVSGTPSTITRATIGIRIERTVGP